MSLRAMIKLRNNFPIVYFDGNLIFNKNGDCWALYRMKNFDYIFLKEDQKKSMLHSIENFISNAGEKVKILIIPTVSDVRERMKKLSSRLEKMNMQFEIKNIAKEVIEGQCKSIDKNNEGGANEYEVYILVNLRCRKNIIEGVKELAKSLKQPFTKINEAFGTGAFEISKTQLRYYKSLSKDFVKRQGRVAIYPVNEPEEIERLIRRTYYRGLEDKDKVECSGFLKPFAFDKGDRIQPFMKDIPVMCRGIFESPKFKRNVTITHEDGRTSYQAFVPVSSMPDNMFFPGSEYILYLQYLDFPVEVCLNIENIEYQEALKKVERKRQEVQGQIKHVVSNDEYVPFDLRAADESTEELEEDLRGEKSPLIKARVTLCVYADNIKTLEERVAKLRLMYKGIKFFTERPMTDQEQYFMEFLPGTGRYTHDFEIMMTPKTVAGSMFGATTHIGDDEGMYVGYTGNLGSPVFLSLLHACQLNKSASAFVWGALGYGKSFNTNLLVYLHVLNGAKAFIVDPKNGVTRS